MRFLLDAMLGKLATYLRMCGHDTAYALDRAPDGGHANAPEDDASAGIEDDDELLALARAEGRRIVTRDADLAARAENALRIDAKDVEGQLCELRAAGVELSLDTPERCSRCNAPIEVVEGGETPDYAPDPDDRRVWRCPACGQHYWKGSHWADVRERLGDH
jgi:uncharacterized protein with PIN domain